MLATAARPLARTEVETLVREVLRQRLAGAINPPALRESSSGAPRGRHGAPNPLVVNVSARHMHVTPIDLATLFGPGAELTRQRDLYQEGEFASKQLVTLVGPRQRIIPNVRILGPTRSYSQVELSYTDGVYLGIDLPLRVSGNHDSTPGITVLGPRGALTMDRGVIRAKRHVHMSRDDLRHFGVRDGDEMKLRIHGPCGVMFDGVVVRHHPNVMLEVHIDTDEGNACDIERATNIELIK
jgi:propanediol utilization protein